MKLVKYILSVIILAVLASCEADLVKNELPSEEGNFTLTLRTSAPETRIPVQGIESLNENKIETIHYFFYPVNGAADNKEAEPFWGVSTGLDAQIETKIRINLPEAILNNTLFPRPYTTCDVYVIANLPSTIDIDNLADRRLSTLKSLALQASFESGTTQDNFVMEGLGVAEIKNRNGVPAAEGTIDIYRVASKLSVKVKVDLSTAGGDWEAHPSDMTIQLMNGVNNAILGADPTGLTYQYFSTGENQREFESISGGLWECEQFYTYPAKWEVGNENEPYLRISLPCTKTEGDKTEYNTCWYKVILGGDQIVRNTWYDLTIDIGVLGSFDDQEETRLPISSTTYYVADWFNLLDDESTLHFDSTIESGSYLVVEKERYEVFNENKISIPYTSSHKCQIVSTSCTHPNYMTGKDVADNDYSLEISADGKYVVFTNTLDNNINSSTFDFTPYTTTFTIKQVDNPAVNLEKTITIIQYPAIYAEAQANSNWKSADHSNGQNNDQNGYMYVNGYQGYTGDSRPSDVDFFLSAGGLYNNRSPNMYVFTVTTTEGTNYVIGDPRDTEYTYDAGDARWYNGPAVYDGNRELNYYYGTLVANARFTNATAQTGIIYQDDAAAEAGEPTINMIAPKFRLASGYSVLYTGEESETMENLKKRCASYQEDGYPAGRWRMPTRAEFQFIMTQVNKGNLPQLYYSGNKYWCAHGIGAPQDDGTIQMTYRGYAPDDDGYSVRCVYDEWYWENSESYRLGNKNANGTFTPSDTFTWGDMPRNEFR